MPYIRYSRRRTRRLHSMVNASIVVLGGLTSLLVIWGLARMGGLL